MAIGVSLFPLQFIHLLLVFGRPVLLTMHLHYELYARMCSHECAPNECAGPLWLRQSSSKWRVTRHNLVMKSWGVSANTISAFMAVTSELYDLNRLYYPTTSTSAANCTRHLSPLREATLRCLFLVSVDMAHLWMEIWRIAPNRLVALHLLQVVHFIHAIGGRTLHKWLCLQLCNLFSPSLLFEHFNALLISRTLLVEHRAFATAWCMRE